MEHELVVILAGDDLNEDKPLFKTISVPEPGIAEIEALKEELRSEIGYRDVAFKFQVWVKDYEDEKGYMQPGWHTEQEIESGDLSWHSWKDKAAADIAKDIEFWEWEWLD